MSDDSDDSSDDPYVKTSRGIQPYKSQKGKAARRREITALLTNPNLRQVQATLADPSHQYLLSELTNHIAQNGRKTACNYFLWPRAVKAIATNMCGLEQYEQEIQTPKWTANIYSAVTGRKKLSYKKKDWKPYAADDFLAKIIDTRVEPEFIQIDKIPDIPQPERSKALPQGDLLTQLHRYVSGWAHRNGPMLFDQLDESSLLALGVVVEEAIETMLGKSGELMYAEEETEENDGTAVPKEDYRGIDSEEEEEEEEEDIQEDNQEETQEEDIQEDIQEEDNQEDIQEDQEDQEDLFLEDTDGSLYEE